MPKNTSGSIRGLEKSLGDAIGGLENLQLKHQAVSGEQDRAIRERREALINGADQKVIDRADARVAGATQALQGIDDALIVQRDRVAALTAELNAARDLAMRMSRSQEITAHVSAVEAALAAIKKPIAEAVSVLNAAAPSGCPEAVQAALLLGDAANQIEREKPRLRVILEAAARQALEPPKPPMQAPSPRGLLAPQPARAYELHGVPEWPVRS